MLNRITVPTTIQSWVTRSYVAEAAFLRLWSSDTVSQFGAQISFLALPVTAAIFLDATPSQMGALRAAQFSPFIVVGLIAGVIVDRLSHRTILISADVSRAAFLISIPVAASLSHLTLIHLYVVAFLVGAMTVFSDIGGQAILASTVNRSRLIHANSQLESSRSLAKIAGPGLAGVIIELINAPFALLFNSLSYVLSATILAKLPPTAPQPHGRSGVLAEIKEGFAVVFPNRLLRPIVASTGTFNLFNDVMLAVLVLYVLRDLSLDSITLGLVFASLGPGALLGAMTAGWVARRLGIGPAIVVGQATAGLGALLVAVAGLLPLTGLLLMLAHGLIGLGRVVYNVNQRTLRQAITEDRLRGRMEATVRFLVWSLIPVGALLGGWLGDAVGIWPTVVIGALGMALASLWVALSPVLTVKQMGD